MEVCMHVCMYACVFPYPSYSPCWWIASEATMMGQFRQGAASSAPMVGSGRWWINQFSCHSICAFTAACFLMHIRSICLRQQWLGTCMNVISLNGQLLQVRCWRNEEKHRSWSTSEDEEICSYFNCFNHKPIQSSDSYLHLTMPNPPLDRQLIAAYSDEFAKHSFLKQNGFAFLIDISGKLFKTKGSVALRDVEGNLEALSVDYRTDWKFACCFGAFLNPVCMRNGPGVLSGRGSCDGGEPWCRKVQCPPAGGVDSEILWVPEALP